eukprot:5499217-Karenia_brevis.AAC.1
MPILYFDANSQFGCCDNGFEKQKIDTDVCGPYGLGRENFVGHMIREFLEEYNMRLVHTFTKCAPSFYSASRVNSKTHIDHIAVPASLHESSGAI